MTLLCSEKASAEFIQQREIEALMKSEHLRNQHIKYSATCFYELLRHRPEMKIFPSRKMYLYYMKMSEAISLSWFIQLFVGTC